jgi:hypothetical protein
MAAEITKADYLMLAALREGRESVQRIHKKDPTGQAVRAAGDLYENRQYVAAYEQFKPAYDRLMSDMQRVLARNPEFEANKFAREQRKPLPVAKQQVVNMKAHAQQVIDLLGRLLQDLENKPLVRHYLKKRASESAAAMAPADAPAATTMNAANETQLDADVDSPTEIVIGERRYAKTPYAPPEAGSLYCVRDKAKGERIIRVVETSPDGTVRVVMSHHGKPTNHGFQLSIEALAKQAAQGWCNLLVPVKTDDGADAPHQPAAAQPKNVMMRLDIQNFSRCCADIVRANIKFDTQLIKDVGDGPFRAGNYEQAFLTFEQLALGFSSAVTSCRQAIADGRRALTVEKGKLSGKEIQERTTAFIRGEQLINTAQREFSTILEGLRMYLRAEQDTSKLENAAG